MLATWRGLSNDFSLTESGDRRKIKKNSVIARSCFIAFGLFWPAHVLRLHLKRTNFLKPNSILVKFVLPVFSLGHCMLSRSADEDDDQSDE